MIFLMPDTNIWISFLELADLQGCLAALEGLVADGAVELWTTEEILSEVNRDKHQKERKAGVEKGLLDKILQRVDVETEGDLAEAASRILGSPRLYDRADEIAEALLHVEDLLARSRVIQGSEAVNGRVLHRMANGLAPFHRGKKDVRRCINDGIIIEKFASASAETDVENDTCVFISTNKEEFATATNADEPHAHYSKIFKDGCLFTKNIERTVHEIREMVNSGEIPSRFRHSDRKSWNEIMAEVAVVGDHDWFHRHLARKSNIANGTCSLKQGRSVLNPARPPVIGMESWREELASAERKLADNPGLPSTSDPYQAGFAAGALLALKWVQGETQSPSRAMTCTAPERFDSEMLSEVRSV